MELFLPMVKRALEKPTQCLVTQRHHKPKELYQIHLPTFLVTLQKPKKIKSMKFDDKDLVNNL